MKCTQQQPQQLQLEIQVCTVHRTAGTSGTTGGYMLVLVIVLCCWASCSRSVCCIVADVLFCARACCCWGLRSTLQIVSTTQHQHRTQQLAKYPQLQVEQIHQVQQLQMCPLCPCVVDSDGAQPREEDCDEDCLSVHPPQSYLFDKRTQNATGVSFYCCLLTTWKYRLYCIVTVAFSAEGLAQVLVFLLGFQAALRRVALCDRADRALVGAAPFRCLPCTWFTAGP